MDFSMVFLRDIFGALADFNVNTGRWRRWYIYLER